MSGTFHPVSVGEGREVYDSTGALRGVGSRVGGRSVPRSGWGGLWGVVCGIEVCSETTHLAAASYLRSR